MASTAVNVVILAHSHYFIFSVIVKLLRPGSCFVFYNLGSLATNSDAERNMGGEHQHWRWFLVPIYTSGVGAAVWGGTTASGDESCELFPGQKKKTGEKEEREVGQDTRLLGTLRYVQEGDGLEKNLQNPVGKGRTSTGRPLSLHIFIRSFKLHIRQHVLIYSVECCW